MDESHFKFAKICLALDVYLSTSWP